MKQYTFYQEYHYKEDLWFVNTLPKSSILNVELTGITYKDPEYHINRRDEWDFYVLEYVRSGKGYILLGDQKYTVTGGDSYIIRNLTKHEYWSDPDDPLEKVWMNVSGSLINSLMTTFNLNGDVILSRANLDEPFERLHKLLRNEYNIEKISHIILEMFFRISESAFTKRTDQLSLAEKMHQYVDRHISSGIRATDVSDHFHITQIYANRVFKKHYQMTVQQYIRVSTISLAAQLLRSSDLSVGEVSDQFGFCNDNYFAYQFKAFFGVSPKQYQLLNRKESDCNVPVERISEKAKNNG